MKLKKISGFPAGLLFCLGMICGCSPYQDGDMSGTSGYAELSMDIAAVKGGGAAGTRAAGDAEKISTLRAVIFHPDGSVEHNELIYDNPSAPLPEVRNKTFRVSRYEAKTIYLIANAEDLPGLDLENPDGLKDRIDAYEGITPDFLQDAGAIPMSSSYTFNVRNQNVDCGTLYVAFSAVKFTFTFRNEMEDGTSFGVSGLTLYSMASSSYLYPHGTGSNWISDLLAGRTVTAYDIPESAVHNPFELEIPSRLVVDHLESVTLPPLYLPESRNIAEGEQTYTLSLRMGPGGDAGDDGNDRIRDFRLTGDDGPLNSLFRCTHVNVDIIVKSMQQIEVVEGIYGMIEPWTELDPVDGSISEWSE